MLPKVNTHSTCVWTLSTAENSTQTKSQQHIGCLVSHIRGLVPKYLIRHGQLFNRFRGIESDDEFCPIIVLKFYYAVPFYEVFIRILKRAFRIIGGAKQRWVRTSWKNDLRCFLLMFLFHQLKHNQNECLYQLRLILLVYSNKESRVYYKISLSEVALRLFRKCCLKVAYPCYVCLRRLVFIDSKAVRSEVS